MKGLRVAALGLVVGLCLSTAVPAALADDGGARSPRRIVVDAGGWFAGWAERVVGWLGWEGEGPWAVVDSDSCGIDPTGAPKPCPVGGAAPRESPAEGVPY